MRTQSKKLTLIGIGTGTLIFVLNFAVMSSAFATTWTVGPSDCSAGAVNSAITSSADGDTVLLTCSGTINWTSTVTIPATKGIILQVQGGTNTPKGSANFPIIINASSGITAIQATISVNQSPTRITGFKFQNSGTADPFIQIGGQGVGADGLGGFRLDNNYLNGVSGTVIVGIWADQGALYGLIDNNTFFNTYRASDTAYGPYGIQIWNYWHPGGAQDWGKDGWTNPFSYGDQNFVFVEDNLFEQTAAAGGHMRHYISSELGGRYVSRYNTFTNNFGDNNADLHDAHGLCIVQSNGLGARGGEIYANTFNGSDYDRAMQLRGGQWLIYDNVFNQIGAGNVISFEEYRVDGTGCDTTNNTSSPPWDVPPAACPGCAVAAWGANDPWRATASGGTGYPLPEQIFGTYVWNNLNGVTLINPQLGPGQTSTYIQNNRDYFASTNKPATLSTGLLPRPAVNVRVVAPKATTSPVGPVAPSRPAGSGYAPYTYPHPLRSQ